MLKVNALTLIAPALTLTLTVLYYKDLKRSYGDDSAYKVSLNIVVMTIAIIQILAIISIMYHSR